MKLKNILLILLLIGITTYPVLADNEEEKLSPERTSFFINLNNCELLCNQPCYRIDEDLYFPLRGIAQTIGKSVLWDGEKQSISINETDSEKLFPFYNKDVRLYGYKDIAGNIVIEPKYWYAKEFFDERACVSSDGLRYGYIDKHGELAIPAIYKSAYNFNEGIANVSIGEIGVTDVDDVYIYINTYGEQVFEKEFFYASAFSEGYAVVLKSGFLVPMPIGWGPKQEWAYINKDGEFATEQTFDDASSFQDGVAAVCTDGKWSLLNHDFQYITEKTYDDYQDLMDNVSDIKKYSNCIEIEVDGYKKELSKPSFTINNRTYVSAEDMGALLGYKTTWKKQLSVHEANIDMLCLE